MAWITDINRLFERCCQQTSGTEHTEVREAFEILFELLFAIDRDPDMIVFFANEGGPWQVGCDWQRILPSHFTCLAATAGPADYATNVLRIVDGFVGYDRVRYLTAARKTAGKNPKKALNAAGC